MFHIQDPSFKDNKLLHEALLDACSNAIYGAGAYAYVTSSGVYMLMGDEIFKKFIAQGKFHLVAGLDDVTNLKSLETLEKFVLKNKPNLSVEVFISENRNSTFHPKYSWFKTHTGGIIVVGSGNLTAKGLRRNREAFIMREVSEEEINKVENTWNEWLMASVPCLKSINDNVAQEKAQQNAKTFVETVIKKKIVRSKSKEEITVDIPIDDSDEVGAWSFNLDSRVLVAEIPRSATRWKQANFDVETFKNFFKGKPGINGNYRIITRNVLWDGSFGETINRPTVSVKSSNYRVELANPDKLPYPANGRPIGVFAEIAERTFVYMIIFPEHNVHKGLLKALDERRTSHNRVVRYLTTADELQKIAPTLPLLYHLES
jgi:HKD family nuclease